METLTDLFQEQIKDLMSAETQLTKALPKMLKGASTPELKEAIEHHLEETKTHVERLQQIADELGFKPTGKVCHGMKGLIEEGAEALDEDGDESVIDGAIIAAAQRVEHYEISGYGTARAIAKKLGYREAADLLDQTLEEESATDEKLTEIAEQAVYPNVQAGDSGEDEEQTTQSSRRGRGR